jgi:hypothetical protein
VSGRGILKMMFSDSQRKPILIPLGNLVLALCLSESIFVLTDLIRKTSGLVSLIGYKEGESCELREVCPHSMRRSSYFQIRATGNMRTFHSVLGEVASLSYWPAAMNCHRSKWAFG